MFLVNVQFWIAFFSILHAHAFDYEDLVALIQAKQLRSVDAVLPELPEELRRNYTLMYKSRGLQAASALNPRALLFGKDAKFILAFNGDPSQRGFDTFELVQFRAGAKNFEFHQVRFPTEENGLESVQFSPLNTTTDGRISCTACHGGSDPRPNWNHYHVWRDAYGSDDDQISFDEAANYAAFAQLRPNHQRYRWLVQGDGAIDPYGVTDINHRPNLRLSDLLGSLNSHRAKRLLESKIPAWQVLAFATQALACKPSEAQIAVLSAASASYAEDMNLNNIFSKLGITHSQWGTQISMDEDSAGREKPWEHQSGYRFLSEDIAMLVAKQLADQGNAKLKSALDAIEPGLVGEYAGDEWIFFDTLNRSTPYLGHFGNGYAINRGAICPEITDLFVSEYMGQLHSRN